MLNAALLTIIILPRGQNVRHNGSPPHSTGEKFKLLPSTRPDVCSVEPADCFCAVICNYPVSDPAVTVTAVYRIVAQSHIRGCDFDGLRNDGAVNR